MVFGLAVFAPGGTLRGSLALLPSRLLLVDFQQYKELNSQQRCLNLRLNLCDHDEEAALEVEAGVQDRPLSLQSTSLTSVKIVDLHSLHPVLVMTCRRLW